MKVSLFPPLFSILSALLPAAIAYGDDPNKGAVPAEFQERAVLVSSAEGRTCATAFWQGRRLYTNAHVAQQLCPLGICAPLSLVTTRTSGKRERWEAKGTRIAALIRSLDLAELEVAEPPPASPPLELAPAILSPTDTWYAIGFPRCGDLRITSGILLERTPLSFRTSILGNYGSSGSLVIDSEHRLIGIAAQSSSPFQALKAALLRSDFQLEVTPLNLLSELAPQLDLSNLSSLAQTLLRYHEEQVRPRSGLSRLFSGLQFISLVDRLELDWLSSRDAGDVRPWLLLNHYPGEVLSQGEEFYRSTDPSLLKLVLAYDLEYLGARASLTRSLSAVKLNELPNVPAELRASLHDLIVFFCGTPGNPVHDDRVRGVSIRRGARGLNFNLSSRPCSTQRFRPASGEALCSAVGVTICLPDR